MKGEKVDNILVNSWEMLNKELGAGLSVVSDMVINAPKMIIKDANAVCEVNLDELLKSYKIPQMPFIPIFILASLRRTCTGRYRRILLSPVT